MRQIYQVGNVIRAKEKFLRCLSGCENNERNIFILAGDSNMVGSGSVFGSNPSVLVWDTATDDWINTGPLTRGTEQVMVPALKNGCTGATNYVVKVAQGGQQLCGTFFPTSGSLYQNIVNWTSAAKQKLLSANSNPVRIRVIVLNLGTNDALSATCTTAFETNLRSFITNIRTDLGESGLNVLLTGMPSTLHLSPTRTTRVADIVSALRTVSGDTPGVDLVDASTWEVKSDNVHYSKDGQTDQGKAYAAWFNC